MVKLSYQGIVGSPFAVVLFPMVPMWDVSHQKKYLLTLDVFTGGWVGWAGTSFWRFACQLGMDVAPKTFYDISNV